MERLIKGLTKWLERFFSFTFSLSWFLTFFMNLFLGGFLFPDQLNQNEFRGRISNSTYYSNGEYFNSQLGQLHKAVDIFKWPRENHSQKLNESCNFFSDFIHSLFREFQVPILFDCSPFLAGPHLLSPGPLQLHTSLGGGAANLAGVTGACPLWWPPSLSLLCRSTR